MLNSKNYLLYLSLLLPFCLSATVIDRQTILRVDVVADDGRLYPIYDIDVRGKSSIHRAWLEAVNGRPYSLRIQNTSNNRVGLVIAIDGRNIISGQKSYLANTERMYILQPWQTTSYEGWRSSNHRINQFYFTEAENSYAEAWQDHSAMGVIAIAAFNEQKQYRRQLRKSSPFANERAEAPASIAADKAASNSDFSEQEKQVGTGFGEEKYSYARVVSFKPMKVALEQYFYKYEWRDTLCRQEIVACHRDSTNRFWPQQEEYSGYAPYPPG